MNELTRLDPTATVDDVMSVLDADGAVIIKNLAPAGVMDRIETELEPHWADIPNGNTEFIGYRTQRATRLVAISTGCRELAEHPLVMGVMDRLLLPMCQR
jgi:hypothetical protein